MKIRTYLVFAISLSLIAGCDRAKENSPRVEQANTEVTQAGTASPENTSKKEFLAKTREELNLLQQDLDTLREKIASESSAEKEKMKSELEKFQQKQKELENKWSSFREEGSNAWKAFERSFRKSIEDLRNAIKEINAIRK